ncbi:MFS transporter [Streptomyces avicenniae]|uniref:MFS transporter n=1 Tax=Streptomyces avicenniae TaxID=500153 RepID=UPI000699CFB6|nr:MFS transporter [Streptomyces avicenniae]
MDDYRKIWAGNASSNLADGVTFVSLPLLAATLTEDPVAIAGLSIAYTLPRLLSVLGIGVLVDRVDRRKLLYGAGFSRGALFAVLTLVVLSDTTTLTVLYMVYAVMGVIETLADSAAVAILPQAVPAERLDRANAQIAGTQVVVDEFVGPPLGGFLFGLAAFAPSLLNTCVFLLAALAYVRLRGAYRLPEPQHGGERQRFVRQVREGAAWAWSNVVVRTLIAIGGLASVGYMIPFSYLVLYAEEVLGLDSTGYGLLLSASAVGGLLGSVVAAPVRRRIGYSGTVIGALLVGAMSFAVIAVSDSVWVVGFFLAAYIGHAVVWNVMAASIRQKVTPAAMMGRVGSVGRLVGIGGLSAGAGLGGVLAARWGFQTPFAVAAGCFVLCALLMVAAIAHFRAFEHADESGVGEEEA